MNNTLILSKYSIKTGVELIEMAFKYLQSFEEFNGIGSGIGNELHRKQILDSLIKIIEKCEQIERKEKVTYKIIRYFMNKNNEVIKTGLTEDEAKKHCRDDESSSSTASDRTLFEKYGNWFDGYTKEE